MISIHALREEGDRARFRSSSSAERISIHALREEGDPATGRRRYYLANFYPRPPRGGRRGRFRCPRRCQTISIHALREEGDRACNFVLTDIKRFLSTPSARRATSRTASTFSPTLYFYPRPPRGGRPPLQGRHPHHQDISIHALREEGDRRRSLPGCWPWNFYPRPPRGGRQQKQRQNLYFQTNCTTFCTNLEEP